MFKITTTEELMAAVEEAKRARKYEEWFAALLILDGMNSPIPNAKPLAQLLRSGKPVPPGICDLLAEMLDPGVPALTSVRLLPKPITTKKKETEHLSKMMAALTYKRLRAEGASANSAITEASKWNNINDESNFYHALPAMLERWSKLTKRLRGS